MGRPRPEAMQPPWGDDWKISLQIGGTPFTSTDDKRMVSPLDDTLWGLAQRTMQVAQAGCAPTKPLTVLAKKSRIPEEIMDLAARWRAICTIRHSRRTTGLEPILKLMREQPGAARFDVDTLKAWAPSWNSYLAADPRAALAAWYRFCIDAYATNNAYEVAALECMRDPLDGTAYDPMFRDVSAVALDTHNMIYGRQIRDLDVASILTDRSLRAIASQLNEQQKQAVDGAMQRAEDAGDDEADGTMPISGEEIDSKDLDHIARLAKEQVSDFTPDSRTNASGELTIETPELEEDITIKRLLRRPKPKKYGTRPRALHRLMTDQRVFVSTRYNTIGTVLIDASGSMGADRDNIYDTVLKCPAVTVAIYSGDDIEGTLRIVVKDGKVAKDLDAFTPPGGGNIVDIPALEWLAEAQAPRVWVSDGIVTGVGDRTASNLYKRAAEICEKARIFRVPTLKAGQNLVKILNDSRLRRLLRERLYYAGLKGAI